MKNNDKQHQPLFSVTIAEFCEALRSVIGVDLVQPENSSAPPRKLLYGLKELAQYLGCSLATVSRIHKSGVINVATYRAERHLIFDAELVLDLLCVSKQKARGPRGGYRC